GKPSVGNTSAAPLSSEGRSQLLEEAVSDEVTRDRDHDLRRMIKARAIIEDIIPPQTLNRRGPSQDRPAQRMFPEDVLGMQVVQVFFWIVLHHPDFLEDDPFLFC